MIWLWVLPVSSAAVYFDTMPSGGWNALIAWRMFFCRRGSGPRLSPACTWWFFWTCRSSVLDQLLWLCVSFRPSPLLLFQQGRLHWIALWPTCWCVRRLKWSWCKMFLSCDAESAMARTWMNNWRYRMRKTAPWPEFSVCGCVLLLCLDGFWFLSGILGHVAANVFTVSGQFYLILCF